MTLTDKQQQALETAVARYHENEPYTVIAGYAGVGKSTCVRFIIQALGLEDDDVAYVTFTGKAASVLRHKGCPNAMTAHKLLYYSKRLPSGRFIFTPRKTLEGDYSLLIVDEVSMLPKDLWDLLLSHHVPVIALGDPAQLPPVSKDTDNHVLDHPHIFLDEIMRQAAESNIITMSMKIRNGNNPTYSADKTKDALVIPESQIVSGMYDWADQIICATNKKRHEINNYMRAEYGRKGAPQDGDKVIACTNCWDVLDENEENALVNGTIGYLRNVRFDELVYPIMGAPKVPVIIADLETEFETFRDLIIDQTALETGKKFLAPKQEYAIYKSKNPNCPPAPIEFNYGYAITCHKAQGSQWSKVLVFEERFPFDKEEHKRWLYTAVTRPEDKLVLVR